MDEGIHFFHFYLVLSYNTDNINQLKEKNNFGSESLVLRNRA